MTWSLLTGDCIEVMAEMAENSVDAIVTDPPYHLGFMGKRWDEPGAFVERRSNRRAGSFEAAQGNHNPTSAPDAARTARVENRRSQEWHHAWALEALRVLKPGGHLLAFGGTRTYHRLTCALEDAGFEIRDCLAWLYGSGFPKSLDVSKAIDKADGRMGAQTPNTGRQRGGRHRGAGASTWTSEGEYQPWQHEPATSDARRWQGWGTALKPAFEPIVLARKPLSERNVAANVQRWGTGALNVDGCRIGTEGGTTRSHQAPYGESGWRTGHAIEDIHAGRWPANVTLDEEAAAMLDEQSGERPAGVAVRHRSGGNTFGGESPKPPMDDMTYGDTGGASRFFYTAKAGRAERERGVKEYGERDAEPKRRFASGGRTQVDGEWVETHSDPIPMRNVHPTVKPIDLMQWLCRLVTPPGGTVLDPFTGSGSTGIAALREGFGFVGIEKDPAYVEIARARIIGDAPLFNVEEVMPLGQPAEDDRTQEVT